MARAFSLNKTTLLLSIVGSASLLFFLLGLPRHQPGPPWPIPESAFNTAIGQVNQTAWHIILSNYFWSCWWYSFFFQLSEGFAVITLLILLLSHWAVPTILRTNRSLLLIPGFIIAGYFATIAAEWILFLGMIREILPPDYNSLPWLIPKSIAYSDSSPLFAKFIFSMFLLACIPFFLYGGLRFTLFRFAAPTVFFFTIGILLFDTIEFTSHVATFANWSVNAVDILSNCFVFIISGFLTLWGFRTLPRHHSATK